ncbi:MAG: aminomethyltransferase [Microbacteriaceae bacterium]|nr:aminomethyltransferase [Microbacteriaceae bacterium]
MTDRTVQPERLSPLHQKHLDAGASFTDFAGWQMPVRYSSDLAEHHAIRTTAGLFDLSHMAEIFVTGDAAGAALDYALAGKISAIAIGQAKYSLLLSPEGGIIDDVVVYRTGESRFTVVANASNRFPAAEALAARAADFDAVVVDGSDQIALIAVQGPNAVAIMDRLDGWDLLIAPRDLKYYWSTLGSYHGSQAMVGRTGYTGEDGFELYVPVGDAAALWDELMAAGADLGLVPAGLASRDTLRLEAGMPLYGHELNLGTFPVQARLNRVVNLKKEGDFVGRAAVEAGPPEGSRVLVGLRADGRRAGRADYPVRDLDGAEVGVITSGALSPTLGYPVAMAYVDPTAAEPGTELFLDVRGTSIPASVVALPFYKREAK